MKPLVRSARALSQPGHWGPAVALWVVAGLFGVGTAVRWAFMQEVSDMLDCAACLLKPSLLYEVQFLLGMLVIHQLSLGLRVRWQGRAMRALVLMCLIIMLADVAVFKFFMVRFNWRELLKFAGEQAAAADFVRMALTHPAQGLLAVTLLVGLCWVCALYIIRPGAVTRSVRDKRLWAVPLGLAVMVTPLHAVNFHTPYVENALLAFTRPQTRLTPYTTPPALPDAAEVRAPQCVPGRASRAPMVLVVVESMSTFHSKALGGQNDWMPHFDRWLDQGLLVRSFNANGITTEEGLVALLTGLPPVPRPQSGSMFEQYDDVPGALPRYLNNQGYHTAFLTTGNLGFLDKAGWLKKTGFTEIEGHDHPFYDGLPRFHFDAATDEALYKRARQWLSAPPARPFFLTLETVSTHQPYKNPVTGERSLESVVRYADQALDTFVGQLQADGFFNTGYVFITGDHRAMVPVSSQEIRQFGDRAYAQVPMLVLGPGLAGQQVEADFSQTDLLPTIQRLTARDRVCMGPHQGDFWTDAGPVPECSLTRRAYDLDRVVVQCGEQDHPVKLNGNATAYMASPSGPATWLGQIHSIRTGHGWLTDRGD